MTSRKPLAAVMHNASAVQQLQDSDNINIYVLDKERACQGVARHPPPRPSFPTPNEASASPPSGGEHNGWISC
jgi:hypothetical protein